MVFRAYSTGSQLVVIREVRKIEVEEAEGERRDSAEGGGTVRRAEGGESVYVCVVGRETKIRNTKMKKMKKKMTIVIGMIIIINK